MSLYEGRLVIDQCENVQLNSSLENNGTKFCNLPVIFTFAHHQSRRTHRQMNFLHKAESLFNEATHHGQHNQQEQQTPVQNLPQNTENVESTERGFAIPSFLLGPVDKYVDGEFQPLYFRRQKNCPSDVSTRDPHCLSGFAPEIEPVVVREIGVFQTETLNFLENHVMDTFKAIISGDMSVFQNISHVGDLGIASKSSSLFFIVCDIIF